ncbi:DUF5658 family protein [Alkalibaculum sporogenes]|uniref:DUF5658 family protein n=1 Tax=Alkalibaculum sporogenes TaxID=2655001 RepID=UPI003CCD2D6C
MNKVIDIKLSLLLTVVVILNVFDCLATLWGITNNYIVEVNPINRILLDSNPRYFVIFKLITTIFLILAYTIPSKESYYLRYYGGIIMSIALIAVFIIHLKWIFVIFL